ncbi:hypothetical protein CEP52_002165 [Fusarium oligoseptatum]|uniref:Uncharacterized protein n=1 Tax=Fusarium oligoseptatum TaxID=2604345 RepID=A0A428UF70_9HYPO|nr:hypothetical protein CEP52_002165 [Fusarium oligoseptatum]
MPLNLEHPRQQTAVQLAAPSSETVGRTRFARVPLHRVAQLAHARLRVRVLSITPCPRTIPTVAKRQAPAGERDGAVAGFL